MELRGFWVDVGWMLDGFGVDLGWIFAGLGVDLGWIWGGFGVDLEWIWLDLGWIWVDVGWIWGGFGSMWGGWGGFGVHGRNERQGGDLDRLPPGRNERPCHVVHGLIIRLRQKNRSNNMKFLGLFLVFKKGEGGGS